MALDVITSRQVRIKNKRGGGSIAPLILKFELGLRWVVRFTSQPPIKSVLETHRIGGQVGPRACLKALKERKNLATLPGIDPRLLYDHLITNSLSLMKHAGSLKQKYRYKNEFVTHSMKETWNFSGESEEIPNIFKQVSCRRIWTWAML